MALPSFVARCISSVYRKISKRCFSMMPYPCPKENIIWKVNYSIPKEENIPIAAVMRNPCCCMNRFPKIQSLNRSYCCNIKDELNRCCCERKIFIKVK